MQLSLCGIRAIRSLYLGSYGVGSAGALPVPDSGTEATMLRTTIAILFLALSGFTSTAKATSEDDLELARLLTIDQIDRMHGLTFEIYVCRLLESRGYDVENIRASSDYGVDAVASKGDDRIAIQIKRSKHPIDRRAISDASAGMAFYKCNKAMVITNSTASKSIING